MVARARFQSSPAVQYDDRLLADPADEDGQGRRTCMRVISDLAGSRAPIESDASTTRTVLPGTFGWPSRQRSINPSTTSSHAGTALAAATNWNGRMLSILALRA